MFVDYAHIWIDIPSWEFEDISGSSICDFDGPDTMGSSLCSVAEALPGPLPPTCCSRHLLYCLK